MLRVNVIKEMENPYTENYKTLMREIEEDANNWKAIV